ncbi:Calmodulin-like protein 1 [Apostasia shenzhenica]|uniref:Calmodulin-like protein 1 n=1 Tax=Apostasia shenzhenica TaxID=1088818 RepID=A0A2I0BCW8_9ASPA|nr:Calmodulin-like protein 1 [Apostasia shenzhenica]
MSNLRILNFQYQILKRFPALKPARSWLSAKDRQFSDLSQSFHPNADELRRVFSKIDGDGDQKISVDDLRSFLEAIGRTDAASEAKSMVKVVDLNKSGFIELDEFMEIHHKGVTRSEIKFAFWVFDENRDGRIGAEEVMAMLRKLGESCSLEDCRRMVKRVDRSGDGLVDMDDFMILMTKTTKPAKMSA